MQLTVDFGSVSVGDNTARIGISLDREALSLDEAERVFCGRQIWGKIALGRHDPEQGKLFEAGGSEIECVMETKQLGVKPKAYSAGLTFSLGGAVDTAVLCKFAKKQGVLVVDEVREIPDEKAAKPAAEADDSPDLFGETSDEFRAAYEQGMEASVDEMAREECPFDDGPEREGWLAGFDKADEFSPESA